METTEAYRIELEFKGLTKTQNALHKGENSYRRKRKEERNQWSRNVFYAVRGQEPPKPLEKACVTLIRGSSVPPDYDGLVASFKYALDALVTWKILKDDKIKNVGRPRYLWEKAPAKQGYIKIIVEEGKPLEL